MRQFVINKTVNFEETQERISYSDTAEETAMGISDKTLFP